MFHWLITRKMNRHIKSLNREIERLSKEIEMLKSDCESTRAYRDRVSEEVTKKTHEYFELIEKLRRLKGFRVLVDLNDLFDPE